VARCSSETLVLTRATYVTSNLTKEKVSYYLSGPMVNTIHIKFLNFFWQDIILFKKYTLLEIPEGQTYPSTYLNPILGLSTSNETEIT
jgi:hypothetical protein